MLLAIKGRPLALCTLAAAMLAACAPAVQPAPSAAPPQAAAPVAPAKPESKPTGAQAAASDKPAAQVPTLVAKPAPLSPPVTLKMGLLRVASDFGSFTALERGYFEEEGLNLELIDFPFMGQMIPQLAVGALDIGAGGVSAGLFNAVATGIPLKMVANTLLVTPDDKSCVFMVRSDLIDSGRVRDFKDVKGLTFGLGAVGSSTEPVVDRVINEGGLQKSDITIKEVPFADHPAAFANQSIDFVQTFEPFRTRMLDQGIAKVWKTCGSIMPNYELALLAYGPSMETKREAGNRFMVAFLRGVREFRERGLEKREPWAIDLAVKYTNLKDAELWRNVELPRGNPDGYNYPQSLDSDIAWFTASGQLPKAPGPSELLDQSYVDYALSRLGRYKPGCGPNPCP